MAASHLPLRKIFMLQCLKLQALQPRRIALSWKSTSLGYTTLLSEESLEGARQGKSLDRDKKVGRGWTSWNRHMAVLIWVYEGSVFQCKKSTTGSSEQDLLYVTSW